MGFAGLCSTTVALVSLASGCAAPPTRVETPADSQQTFSAGLGQRLNIGGAFVTPQSVTEDSRCPADVQCVQAGTVRMSIRIEQPAGTSIEEIGLEAPYDMGQRWLHLTGACPYPRHSGPKPTSTPRFSFMANPSSSPRPPGASC